MDYSQVVDDAGVQAAEVTYLADQTDENWQLCLDAVNAALDAMGAPEDYRVD